jgi:hypothetical protein
MTNPLIMKKSSTPRYPYFAAGAKEENEMELMLPLEIPLKR